MRTLRSAATTLLFALASLVCAAPAAAQTVEYVHTDALGSVVAATDANRNVIERREYEPYGYQLTPALQNGPGYTGHVQDAATGLVYMQQRYYDPVVGRFLSPDPVTELDGGDMRHFSRYAYAYGNPYRFTDPDGRCPVCVGVIIYAIGALTYSEQANAPAPGEATVDNSAGDALAAALPPARALVPLRMAANAGDRLSQREAGNGRSGRQERLREIGNDPKASSADRGWIKNEQRQVEQGNRTTIRNPPGKELAHERGREAAKGYDYKHSNLQDKDLHRNQHKFDDFGRANKERPPR